MSGHTNRSIQDNIDLVHQLLVSVSNEFPFTDSTKLDALVRRAKMVISKAFGSSSSYIQDLERIDFDGSSLGISSFDSPMKVWKEGQACLENLCKVMLEDLQMQSFDELRASASEVAAQPNATPVTLKSTSNKIFIVHGHDVAMKSEVARTVEKIGLEPIILHEQPDMGRTVIEKFVDHSDVGFAIVLLSPDDMAYVKTADPTTARPRARQNVVLELGFFLGKLGRQRVVALHKVVPEFEMPSDYSGVLFKAFDDAGHWRFELVRELKACGYDVDANKLIVR